MPACLDAGVTPVAGPNCWTSRLTGAGGVITIYARIEPGVPLTGSIVNWAQVAVPADRDPTNNQSRAFVGTAYVYLPLIVKNSPPPPPTAPPTATATPTTTPTSTPSRSGIHGVVTEGEISTAGVAIGLGL
jgi:hypothetical protein